MGRQVSAAGKKERLKTPLFLHFPLNSQAKQAGKIVEFFTVLLCPEQDLGVWFGVQGEGDDIPLPV